MSKRGKIILIEGTDSSGKETQTRMLLERLTLENIPCERMSFPRYDTPTGRIIGQCYLGKEGLGEGDVAWFGEADEVNPLLASLYFAADRFAAAPEIRKIIDSGRHLILDRYTESNMAHQGGKVDIHNRLRTISFIHNLEYELLKLPKPDKVIFLYMPYQIGIELKKRSRIKADGHEANLEHLKKAEETYLQLAKEYWWTWKIISCAPDRTMKSLRTPKDIAEEVYSNAINLIRS